MGGNGPGRRGRHLKNSRLFHKFSYRFYLLAVGLAFASAGALAAPAPFDTCPSEAFIGRGTSSDTISLYTLSLVNTDMAQQGTSVLPSGTNGLGFRSQDGFIYGWSNLFLPARLVRVGKDGVYEFPFATPPTGPGSAGALNIGFYIADVQPSTGYYVGASSTSLYFIDVTTNKVIKKVNLVGNTLDNVTDMAFNPVDNQIYAVYNQSNPVNPLAGKILRINPDTGATTVLNVNKQNSDGTVDSSFTTVPLDDPSGGGFGAIFFDSVGTMYAYKSGGGGANGAIFRIYNTAGSTPSYSRGTNTLTASNLDGARCAAAPPPYGKLQVNKTVSGATSASDLTFKYTVTCAAPSTTSSGSVTVEAGATSGSSTLDKIPVGSAGCKIAEDTTALPTAPIGYTWDTPTYTQPTDFISGTTTIAGTITNPLKDTPGTLTVTKTTPTKYIKYEKQDDGSFKPNPATITYTITVSANGAGARNAVVTDTLPANLSNVSVSQGAAAVPLTDSANAALSQPIAGPTTAGQVVKWKAGDLAAGTSATYTVTATLPSAATLEGAQPQAAMVNNAAAKGDNTTTATDSATSQTIYTRLFKQVHNLGASATANSPAVPASTPAWESTGQGLPGDVLEYCIDFANYGSTALPSYGLADHVPDNATFMPGSIFVKTGTMKITPVAAFAGATSSYNTDTKTVSANVGTLAAGATGSLCFRAKIN